MSQDILSLVFDSVNNRNVVLWKKPDGQLLGFFVIAPQDGQCWFHARVQHNDMLVNFAMAEDLLGAFAKRFEAARKLLKNASTQPRKPGAPTDNFMKSKLPRE